MKSHQLPCDKPGIIVITTTGNMLLFAYDIHEIQREMENQGRDYQQLLCVVVSHQFQGESESAAVTSPQGNHTIFKNVLADPHTEAGIVLFNDHCTLPVSTNTKEKIRSAFVGQ